MSSSPEVVGAGERTRRRIISAAAAAFRRHGFAGVGVRDVMKLAGLTPGSFYFHFKDKDELFVEASHEAFSNASDSIFSAVDAAPPARKIATLIAQYLSSEHRDAMDNGCTMAALGADAARRGPRHRRAFGHASEVMVARIATCLGDGRKTSRDLRRARLLAASMAGVLMASRVIADREDGDLLLADARQHLIRQFADSGNR